MRTKSGANKKSIYSQLSKALVFGFFVFLILASPVKAQELDENLLIEIPAPTIEIGNIEGGSVSGDIHIYGQALNFSSVEIFVDGIYQAEVLVELGTTGYGSYTYTLPQVLSFRQHNISVVTKYFENTRSSKNTTSFEYVQAFPGPTLLDPVFNSETTFNRPWIVGLAHNGSVVEIYIDGKLDGQIKPQDHESGVTSFRYKPSFDLDSGFHSIKAIATNKDTSIKSSFSNEVVIEIRGKVGQEIKKCSGLKDIPENFIAPVPAPTMLIPQSGTVVSSSEKIEVSAVVKNDHTVMVYVDDQKVSQFIPPPHQSGTTSFKYIVEQDLTPGIHTVSAKAINSRGIVSGISNTLQLLVVSGTEKIFSNPAPAIESGVSSEVLGDSKYIDTEPLEQDDWSADWLKFIIALIIVAVVLFTMGLIFEKEKIKKFFEKDKDSNTQGKMDL